MSEDTEKSAPEGNETKSDAYEPDARRQGWVNADEWAAKGGDPTKHKTAEAFVKDGERIVPILKAKMTRLEKTVESLKQSHARERKATLDGMAEANRLNEERVKRAIAEAVSKGDGDKTVQLQDKLHEIKDQAREIKDERKGVEQANEAPEFVAFLEENEWYSTDKDLQEEADALGLVIRSKTGALGADLFNQVASKIKARHPDKFGKRKPASPDTSTRNGDGGSKPKGVPKDTMAQYKRMADYVPPDQREKYLKNLIANYQAEE